MKKKKIAVVVPTIRPESLRDFVLGWREQFEKYKVTLIVVYDGKKPTVSIFRDFYDFLDGSPFRPKKLEEIMGDEEDLISNFNSSVRNLGFVVAKRIDADVIVTLDDDTRPLGDTIGDHLKALEKKVPISWISTTLVDKNTDYMRGFPYGIREEAEVVVSHGVWQGVPDRDAPTQLVAGERAPVDFFRGPIPKGIYFPFCGMNVAFKIEALPFIYYCPVGQFKGAERFDDIWGGVAFKKDLDDRGLAVVSGYASVKHERASDPYKNLEREVIGIKENEGFWNGTSEHKFFDEFRKKRERWNEFISQMDLDLF